MISRTDPMINERIGHSMSFQHESLHIAVADRLFSVSVNVLYLSVFLNRHADQFYQVLPGNPYSHNSCPPVSYCDLTLQRYDDYLKLASVLQEKMPRTIFRCEAFCYSCYV